MIELQIPEELTDGGRYSPEARFIDEISDELDVIEDKKAPLLCKTFKYLLVSFFKFYCFFFHSQTQNQENVHPNANHFETFQVEIVALPSFHFGLDWVEEDTLIRCLSNSRYFPQFEFLPFSIQKIFF